jgi:putative transposase
LENTFPLHMSIDWIPARNITSKTEGNRGYISTTKNPSGIVEYESCIERDFLIVAIHDPTVRAIQHQPKTILYFDTKGEQHKYTPDVYLEFKDGSRLLVEIKPLDEVTKNHQKYEQRWNAARMWAESNGISFIVVTDGEIRTPRWVNIWFTLGASKSLDNDKYIQKLTLIIDPDGDEYNNLCVKAAREFGVGIGKAAQIICYAVYHGLVFVDNFSTRQLSKDTIIRRKVDKDSIPFNSLWDELLPRENGSTCEPMDLGVETNETLECVTEDEFLEKRKEMVLAWLKQPANKRTGEWRKVFCEEWGLSKSQIYRIIAQYSIEGVKGLKLRYYNSGRNKKYGGKALELMETARIHYLKAGVTFRIAYEKLDDSCKENQLDTPTLSTFKRYVYQNTISSEKARKIGTDFTRSHFTPSLNSFQGGSMPLQMVQIDNTMLDIFPVDEAAREALSTPHMTASIDSYTGMITGFTVSYFPSSAQSILEVLVQTILPKTEYTAIYETEHEWPVQGFPVVLLVDNGMDYRSTALQDFCRKYDIILEFVPIRTPRYKAYIEQWFNVLKNAMRQEPIPGFRPPLKLRMENPGLKPESEAIMTLSEIETWLYKWIVDEHQFSNQYDDHVLAPFLRLQDVKEGKTRLIFPEPRSAPSMKWEIDALHLAPLEQETRTLTKDGIQWEYLKYNSKELAEVHRTQGDGAISVRRDRRDVRSIWIQNPSSNAFIKVGLGSGWAATLLDTYGDKPVHESAWIKAVKLVKVEVKERLTPYLFKTHVSKLQRMKLIDTSKTMKKKARKELEKQREAMRRDISTKITHTEANDQSEKTATDDGHSKPRKEIDWSKITRLPTDDFYSER